MFDLRKTYSGKITKLLPNQIYTFGANTQGRHSKGSALIAREKFGAIYGRAEGLQNQSYAIITKDLTKRVHPSRTRDQIIEQIKKLYNFSTSNTHLEFWVVYTASSENLNNYSPKEMAELFACVIEIPKNIIFEEGFYRLIQETWSEWTQK